MSKDLEYEVNNFANLLHKDCMNLMECLKKQSEDNKPILYLGKHYQKVILPYEEYQKMCNRLESIDNAEPSEALKCVDKILGYFGKAQVETMTLSKCNVLTIKQALLKAQKEHKALEIIKEKNVNMFGFKRDIKQLGNRFTYKYYQSNLGNYHSGFDIQELTEEEFNLLKEVLE